MKLSIALLLIVVGSSAEVARFHNYRVFRLLPETDEQVIALRSIENEGSDFDFWKGVTGKGVPVDVMVPPHKLSDFNETVRKLKLSSDLYIGDVQKTIDINLLSVKYSDVFDWESYHSLSKINEWLDNLAAQHKEVEVVVGGKSYEGRDIKGVKVSYKVGNKAVFVEGGIHAREWISPATVTYILNQLLSSTDPSVREVAESYDWYFFPSINPDGYQYTHNTNRLWRKTRKSYGLCHGADPNRNWGYHWMDGGSSRIPCADTFAGSRAFSEPETKSLSEFITTIHKDLIGYIAFHSYSQYLLLPYGYTNKRLDNYDELMEIGNKSIASLSKKYGTNYTLGNIVDVIYVASGGSMDWVKGTYKTPITYTYELRDTGRYGFLLPADQIIPTGEETLDSFITIIQEAKKRGY